MAAAPSEGAVGAEGGPRALRAAAKVAARGFAAEVVRRVRRRRMMRRCMEGWRRVVVAGGPARQAAAHRWARAAEEEAERARAAAEEAERARAAEEEEAERARAAAEEAERARAVAEEAKRAQAAKEVADAQTYQSHSRRRLVVGQPTYDLQFSAFKKELIERGMPRKELMWCSTVHALVEAAHRSPIELGIEWIQPEQESAL